MDVEVGSDDLDPGNFEETVERKVGPDDLIPGMTSEESMQMKSESNDPMLGRFNEGENEEFRHLFDDLTDDELLHLDLGPSQCSIEPVAFSSEDFLMSSYFNLEVTPEDVLLQPYNAGESLAEYGPNDQKYLDDFFAHLPLNDPSELEFDAIFNDATSANIGLRYSPGPGEIKQEQVTPEEILENLNMSSGDSGKGSDTENGTNDPIQAYYYHEMKMDTDLTPKGSSKNFFIMPEYSESSFEHDHTYGPKKIMNEEMKMETGFTRRVRRTVRKFFTLSDQKEKPKARQPTVKTRKRRATEVEVPKKIAKRPKQTANKIPARPPKTRQTKDPRVVLNPTKAELLHLATIPGEECFDPSQKLGPLQLKLIQPLDKNSKMAQMYAARACPRVERHRRFRRRRRVFRNQLVYHAAYLENLNDTLKQKVQEMNRGV